MHYTIRRGRSTDAGEFLCLVEELARFEKLDPPDTDARFRLVQDAFKPHPPFELWVAEADGVAGLVGYAMILPTYSSFLARPSLYIEDIYLTPEHRGTGLARQFLGHLAALAIKRGWGRIEGIVLGRNERARRFYRSTGAAEMTDWVFFRYDAEALGRLESAQPARGPS